LKLEIDGKAFLIFCSCSFIANHLALACYAHLVSKVIGYVEPIGDVDVEQIGVTGTVTNIIKLYLMF
jgi:hypothetical protein